MIAVGDVRDYTGKYSVNEGNALTQGGALMVASALGKLRGSVRIAERFDPTIGERELVYADRRQLGDGKVHDLAGPSGNQIVPWLPYYGGSIAASDYYIVGGITELNYNIRSGGSEVAIGNAGPKLRTFTQSVAIDLRIVDTRSLLVVRTISLTKQFTGYETGLGIFRFFGSQLFDINLGTKAQEPLQLGVRAALEEATMRLVGAAMDVDPSPCMAQTSWAPAATAATLVPVVVAALPKRSTGDLINSASTGAGLRQPLELLFETGSADLTPTALGALDRMAAKGTGGEAVISLLARDNEALEPRKRDALLDQRLATVTRALARRGIGSSRITVSWRVSAGEAASHSDGAGRQRLADLRIQ